MKETKVLITGAGGFLGSSIVRLLIKKNYQVFSFSRSEYPFLKKLGVIQHIGDLKNYSDIEKAIKGMDAVIHTAGMVGMWGKYKDFFATNVTGTKNIIKAMKVHKVNKLIYTSTPSVTFEKESLCGVNESTPYATNFLTHYAKTKSIAEKMVLEANDSENEDGFFSVALRPHLIFGPGDMNLIPRVIEAQKKGRLKVIGDGENLVDVIFVDNAAAAHVMALEKLNYKHPIAGNAYYLGQGPVKLWDFINTILTRSGLSKVSKKISLTKAYYIGFAIECFLKIFRIYNIHPPMTRFVALQLGKSHYFNHHKIELDLGYKPEISITEGLEKLFASQSTNQ